VAADPQPPAPAARWQPLPPPCAARVARRAAAGSIAFECRSAARRAGGGAARGIERRIVAGDTRQKKRLRRLSVSGMRCSVTFDGTSPCSRSRQTLAFEDGGRQWRLPSAVHFDSRAAASDVGTSHRPQCLHMLPRSRRRLPHAAPRLSDMRERKRRRAVHSSRR